MSGTGGPSDITAALRDIQRSLANLFSKIGTIAVSVPPGGANGNVQYNNNGAFGGLTDVQLTARIQAFTNVLSGAVPASGGGTTTWLRADGSFTAVTARALAIAQSTPGNPTGTNSLVGVMMGLAGAITPVATGKVLIIISGDITNASAIADGGKVQIRYGTGTAPSNADALTGTTAGGLVRYIAATTAEVAPFSLNALVTGLSVSTAYWIDVGLAAITGGTTSIADLSVSAVEVY